MLTYYPTTQLESREHVASAPINDDILGLFELEANVPLSHAVELTIIKRLRELYPDGIKTNVMGSVLSVTCGLFMAEYQSVNYSAKPM